MNIEQVKKDLDERMIISPITYRKLVEAALMMQEYLNSIQCYSNGRDSITASEALEAVEAL